LRAVADAAVTVGASLVVLTVFIAAISVVIGTIVSTVVGIVVFSIAVVPRIRAR
jgi:hypothetical protein